jgi:hypothetical protein
MHGFALADRWSVNATGPSGKRFVVRLDSRSFVGTFAEMAPSIRRMQCCLAPLCRSDRLAVGQQVASDADPDGLSVSIAGRA